MKKNLIMAAAVLALAGTQTAFAADATKVSLSDDKILVNGKEITENEKNNVYLDYIKQKITVMCLKNWQNWKTEW